MESSVFMVNQEPYCIWEYDIKQRNLEFLNGIDAEYFDFMLKTLLSTEDEERASIGLRIIFHHALETLFSLLGALVQAPDCIYAWVAKCSNDDLRSVVEKISKTIDDSDYDFIYHKLNVAKVSWPVISGIVFNQYLPGSDKNKRTVELFATLWGRLSSELLGEANISEYNSFKHGFRVSSGGFALAAGVEHEYGVAPPDEEMELIGSSKFGSSHIKVERIGNNKKNRCLKSRKVSLNWSIQEVALLLQLTSMSIANVISALKILSGVKAGDAKFVRPVEDSIFEKAWDFSTSLRSSSFQIILEEDRIPFKNKDQIIELLRQTKEQRRKESDAGGT